MWKTLGCAMLVWNLAPLNAVAIDDAKNTDSEEQKTAPRSLEPTPEELARFSLQPTDVGARGDAFPAQGGSPLFQIAGFGMFAAAGTDFATTEIGLSRGLEEGNPIASNRSLRLLHHVVGPAAVWWTTSELQKKGKTRLATSLRIFLMAAYGYATLHNLRQVGGTP
jgi:hypothetical protein